MREEEKKRSSQTSDTQNILKKRWVFPAIYIASAAIILTGVLWFQNGTDEVADDYTNDTTDVADNDFKQPSIEVNRTIENFVMPVTNPNAVVIQTPFYDMNGQKEEQEAALVFYNNTYHPNQGIDITMESGETFDVVAALSGTVTKVEEDSLLGNVIEIEHDKGIVTQYQSVSDFKVEVGDRVEQGQTLASAAQSLFNEEAGVHVHFEMRKDSVAVNPIDFFNKPLTALQEYQAVDNSATREDDGTADEPSDADDKEDPADGQSNDQESDTSTNS